MGPIDYSQQVVSPFQAALQGYQGGAAVRDDQLALQQRQAAIAQQQRQQELLANLASKPNASADDYASVMTQIPALAEPLTKVWATKNEAQQQSHASDLLQWGAAIKNGQPEIAADRMIARAEAMEAGGKPTPESQALRANAEVLRLNPQMALGVIQAQLAANPRGKQAADALATLGAEQRETDLAPSKLTKSKADADAAVADAETKRVQAKYADSTAILDLQKKGWDIKKIEADIGIAKENARIAAMNAAVAREGNDLKRQELQLKLEEARTARDTKVREKVATAESGASSIDNMLNTIERIKTNPQLDNVVGSLEGRMPAAASLLDDEESDAIALIETLGSQAFLAQIPNIKGMGALSNAEGEKLQSALQNLGRAQSEKQFRANLDEAARLLKKGRESISRSTGVPLGKPDTPAAPGARPPLSSFER